MSHHQAFELRETVENAIAQFAGAAGDLDLISHLSDNCPAVVIGDVIRLRQVLGHLVGNAVSFTEHGDVLLRVELDDDQPRDGVRLRFTVADTGIGIAPEILARPMISKAIVEAMGGELAVTSTLGDGSEFTFDVVLGRSDDRRSVARPRPGNVELAPLADRNVLVVDGDDANRRGLRRQVEGYGMVCTTSASPLDALALVGGGRGFDIAIIDFALPMMDGVQLAVALRRLPAGHRLPLVLLSSAERSDRSHDTLFAAVLTKPTHTASQFDTASLWDTTSLFDAITRVLPPDPIPQQYRRSVTSDQRGPWTTPLWSQVVMIPRPSGPCQPSQPFPARQRPS